MTAIADLFWMFQVEYYFSDINLATTDLLMRSITKDPEGFGKSFSIYTYVLKTGILNRQKLSFWDKWIFRWDSYFLLLPTDPLTIFGLGVNQNQLLWIFSVI